MRREERGEVVPGEPDTVEQKRKRVRREGRMIPSPWSSMGETGPGDASRGWGHGTPGPVSTQGAERDGRASSAGPRGPISRARAVRDFVRTVRLTGPEGDVSTVLSALYGELPALPTARRAGVSLGVSTEDSGSFPRDRTRYWPIASDLRPSRWMIIGRL